MSERPPATHRVDRVRSIALPPVIDQALLGSLRDDLADADFSVPGLTRLWGERADAALFRGHRVPALMAIEHDDSPVAVLATLFVLGIPVPSEAVTLALPRLGVDGAVALGLIRVRDDMALPQFDLRPYSFSDAAGEGSWWILSDLGELALGTAIDEAHVLGIGGASATLAAFTVQHPVEAALDLGTGCGIQALHAARHARRVIATDISTRALTIAAFNASLNGVNGIEFREGSLYEPVAGERFDLIVSNPPFVITPRTAGVPAYEYRDGGMVGDGVVAAVVRGAEQHLSAGGIAQFLGNWEYREGTHAYDRITEWLVGSDLDAWVIEREVQDPAAYAETWIRDGGTRPGPEFDRLERAWIDDFDDRGVQQVGFGYIALRRGSGGLRRIERVQHELPTGGLGEHVHATLTMAEVLAGLDDDALAHRALVVADDVTEERHLRPGDDDPTAILLRQGGGLGRAVSVDTALAATVGACDGELTPAAIAAAIGELLEVDARDVLEATMPRLRELLVTGFLRMTTD